MNDRLSNIHPGDILYEEFLVPLKMSAYALAKGLGVSSTAVTEILKRKRAISPVMALRLERFFGCEAEFWMNLQTAYDVEEARWALKIVLDSIDPCELEEMRTEQVVRLAKRRQELREEWAARKQLQAGGDG